LGFKKHKDELWVITDVRFQNEALRIKELGGYVIEIDRPELKYNDLHISEERLPNDLIYCTISNDGSLEQFKERMLEVVSKLI